MNKSVRSIALLSVMTLAALPMFAREPMGTDPRPYAAPPASFSTVVYTVLAFFGK